MVQNGSHDTESGIKLDIRSRFSLRINFLFIILVRIVDAKATEKKWVVFTESLLFLTEKWDRMLAEYTTHFQNSSHSLANRASSN